MEGGEREGNKTVRHFSIPFHKHPSENKMLGRGQSNVFIAEAKWDWWQPKRQGREGQRKEGGGR